MLRDVGDEDADQDETVRGSMASAWLGGGKRAGRETDRERAKFHPPEAGSASSAQWSVGIAMAEGLGSGSETSEAHKVCAMSCLTDICWKKMRNVR